MNKKICIIVLTFIIVLVLISVFQQKNKKTKSPYTEFTDSIKLTIKDDEIIDNNMTVIFTNESETSYEYGLCYEIEFKEGNNWYVLKPKHEVDTTLMAYSINQGESKEIDINFTYKYGDLSKGHYRLIKLFSYKVNENEYKEVVAAVEFNIK